MGRKKGDIVTPWEAWEDAYIQKHYNTVKNGEVRLVAYIAKHVMRPYNEVNCHIKYLKRRGKLKGERRPAESVWTPEVETKREFLNAITEKMKGRTNGESERFDKE